MDKILKDLYSMQDMQYQAFHSKLIPTVASERIIGVRTPQLRKYAKEISGSELAENFLKTLPHKYYEENNLHGMLLELRTNYTQCIAELEFFLPHVDNWATCDLISPKVFKKHLSELLIQIEHWLHSKDVYMVRFGIGMLMKHYLDIHFKKKYLDMVASLQSDEYYINMMIAWYFATALAKQYSATLPYLEDKILDRWTHNKTIQKAVESYRITSEQKEYLKTLKQ